MNCIYVLIQCIERAGIVESRSLTMPWIASSREIANSLRAWYVISLGYKFFTITFLKRCFVLLMILSVMVLYLARNQRGWSWILTILIVQFAYYDAPRLRFATKKYLLLTNKTVILDIARYGFTSISIFLFLSLVHKGYRAISGRVEFNPLYRKPQAAALHLDYSRTQINDRWSIIIYSTKLSPLPIVKDRWANLFSGKADKVSMWILIDSKSRYNIRLFFSEIWRSGLMRFVWDL